ncbi:class I SAM-dependent methyltransferase [Streptosporangium sp. NPDC051023]|uniref:class I SAM-dependent methyltransferase n=1 Tax=Streptosporangium sp. NPDC051023 TaxID=3155410 RepID=UPI00344FF676
MLVEAERQAKRRRVTNTRWVAARAEDLPADLGDFRVVVFANHWTDRDRVAATVLEMLEPEGTFVHMSDLKLRPAPVRRQAGGLRAGPARGPAANITR